MNKQVVLSANESFQIIAEAAMLAPLPQVFKEALRKQIVAFGTWIDSISELEKKCDQLELDLEEKNATCEQ